MNGEAPGHTLPPRLGERALSTIDEMVLREIDRLEDDLAGILDNLRSRAHGAGDMEAIRWVELAREKLECGILLAERAILRPLAGLGRGTQAREQAKREHRPQEGSRAAQAAQEPAQGWLGEQVSD